MCLFLISANIEQYNKKGDLCRDNKCGSDLDMANSLSCRTLYSYLQI